MTTFTLEPQENDRLQSLCGAFDENIKLIEKEFNLNISRNNFTFTVKFCFFLVHLVVGKPPYCVALLVLNNQQAVRFG